MSGNHVVLGEGAMTNNNLDLQINRMETSYQGKRIEDLKCD